MPTFRHGKKTAILFGSNNLSQYLNSVGVANSIDTNETTTFGNDAKTYITGIESATFSLSGLYEGSENDPVLNNALNQDTFTTITSGSSTGTNVIAFTVPTMTIPFGAGQIVTVAGTSQSTHNVTGVIASSPAPTVTSFSLVTNAVVASASSTGGTATNSVIQTATVAQEGLTAGTMCFLAGTRVKSYEIKSSVADVIQANVECEADNGLDSGKILQGATTINTIGANNGATLDNGASLGATTRGYVAHLHVTANTWTGTATFAIQHSTDGSSWNTLDTFTVVPASSIYQERKVSTSATVNRYVRALATLASGTGSVTYSMAISRR